MSLDVRITTSLRGFTDQQLLRVTDGASVFFDTRWFRLADSLDLSDVLRGCVRLHYVTVTEGGQVIAVCPFLVCPDPSVYFFYSLDKYFFRNWYTEAMRLAPERARFWRRLKALVTAYRSFARATGVRLDGWVLAVSPMSHRGDIALAPVPSATRRLATSAVLDALKDVARQERMPLCFFAVEESREELRSTLMQEAFEEVFLVYDNLLSLEGCGDLEDYFARFRSDARRRFRREMTQSQRSGIRSEITSDLRALGEEFGRLYHATYARYGSDHLHHGPEFWHALSDCLGPQAKALVARRGREILGFSLLLEKKDLWFYRVGRRYDQSASSVSTYFNLAFYEPIRCALEGRRSRLWLGAGAWEAKHRRGALGHALYSYLWFPHRWDRWVLMPYLRGFGQITRDQMARLTRPSSSLREPSHKVPAPHFRVPIERRLTPVRFRSSEDD